MPLWVLGMLLIGAGMVCYPFIASKYNARHQSMVTTEYQQAMAAADTSALDQARADAEAYNEGLRSGGIDGTENSDYHGQLAMSDIMGSIRIPAINVDMPIYHGVSSRAMTLGAGHMPGSSLPIGGDSTHSVISSHSGLASHRGFTDLPQLKIGDRFYVDVLGETLTYEVTEIQTVLPHEIDSVRIVQGQDLFSLVTCVPLFVNSHRLVVTGSRVPDGAPEPTAAAHQTAEISDPMEEKERTQPFIRLTAGIAAIAIPAAVIWRKRK